MTDFVWVMDSYAVMEIGELLGPLALDSTLNDLTDRVAAGSVRFPDLVPKECHRFSDAGVVAVWIKAVAAGRPNYVPDYQWQDAVLADCPELLDDDLAEWQPQIEVAALARYTLTTQAVTVVTGDYRERPERMSLKDACVKMGLPVVTTAEFLAQEYPHS